MMKVVKRSTDKEMKGNVFLIGFMGSGKTYWGNLWAAEHQTYFIDLDHVIEKIEGQKIVEIFETRGENHFRELEAQILRGISPDEKAIIACGGGTPCFHENLKWMNENGTTVYFKTTPPEILEKVEEEREKRPLLKNLNQSELLFFIEQKLKEREPFYSQAKIILNASDITAKTFSEKILAAQL